MQSRNARFLEHLPRLQLNSDGLAKLRCRLRVEQLEEPIALCMHATAIISGGGRCEPQSLRRNCHGDDGAICVLPVY
jgi:hypothetical protein